MGVNVFSNIKQSTETWSLSGAAIYYGKGSGGQGSLLPLICNNLRLQYQRSINPLYPINVINEGTLHRVNITGNPQGNLTVGVIIGPNTQGVQAFLQTVTSSVCGTDSQVYFNVVPFSVNGCENTSNNLRYILTGVTMNSIALDISNQGGIAIVNQPLTFEFTSMEIDGGGLTTSAA